MPDTLPPTPYPCRHCGSPKTVANGRSRGHHRWLCRACGRTFGTTTGTPLAGLKTPPAEIAQALLIVLRRGSLRAAEEITGHKYETIGAWLDRAGRHAEALTDDLVHDLDLDEVEADEFWSFVRTKGNRATRKRGRPAVNRGSRRQASPPNPQRTSPSRPPRTAVSTGEPSRSPGGAASSSPGPPVPGTSGWPTP